MKKLFIYAYKNFSSSAKKLAELLPAKRIKHKNSKFIPSDKKLVINWGSTKLPDDLVDFQKNILNKHGVDVAVNKLKTLNALKDKPYCLEFTQEKDVAKKWIDDGQIVVCRKLLTGNSGNGIIIAEKHDDLVDAPLYTKHLRHKEEYRVHVFKGEVLQVQRKAIKKDFPKDKLNMRVRNHNNGFIFQIHDFEVPKNVVENAIDAVKTLGLDFGAVDVAYKKITDKSFILEVNTAPGIEGTTLKLYTEQFLKESEKYLRG